ncbi:hypothetical protein GGX14DRAFT_445031 [Mycena pura]|uniref:Uncharacterized protein n=1 Tax=Mycena pura TaxID=153505 RepID=A0AAD6VHV3_9AGAR|nr:hypothetical protein GGX14DRAFT_445031 [Mycena pura]
MRLSCSAGDPWLPPTVDDIQPQMDRVYGQGKYVVNARDVWTHLLHYRCHDWRRMFLDFAMRAFKKQIEAAEEEVIENAQKKEAQLSQGLDDIQMPDEENDAFDLTTPEGIAEYVAYQLDGTGDGHTKHFHWKDFNAEEPGLFGTYLLLYTFAAHLSFLDTLPVDLARSEERPYTAVLMAIQAVEYMLLRWTTGAYVPPSREQKEQFSADNWGDYTESVGPKKQRILRRATKFLKTLQEWTDEDWEGFLEEAAAYKEKGRRNRRISSRASSRASSQAPDEDDVIEEAEEQFVICRR